MKEYSYKDFAVPPSIKDVDGRKGIVTGYFAHFDNVDADGDIIRIGAFSKTIKENGPKSTRPRIKHLFNHDPSKPLGVINELKEDPNGLYYESQIGVHELGKDFIKMVDSGLISEHSIGYQVMQSKEIQSWNDYTKNPTNGHKELTALKLYEGSSLSAWGANELTPLTGIKSVQSVIDKSESIAKFCRDSNATDETIELLLIYNKQLVQAINDLKTTQPALHREDESHVTAIVPEVKIDEQVELVLLPEAAECPSCNRFTHNTQAEKGYIVCHRCEAQFVYGSKLFIKI